jgi:hypothetical protein
VADKDPADVPSIPIPPMVDLTGTGGEPNEKTVARPRKKAEPKAVPPAVPPATVAPVEAAPATPAPAAPQGQSDPSAQPNPYVQPNPYAAAPAAPNPYATPVAPQNPYATGGAQPPAYGAPQPYVNGPYVAQPPKALSIVSMALGIGGVVFCGTLFLVSVAAVVTGHLAMKRQPYAKGFWLTGLIAGYAGIALGLMWGAITILPSIFYAISGRY